MTLLRCLISMASILRRSPPSQQRCEEARAMRRSVSRRIKCVRCALVEPPWYPCCIHTVARSMCAQRSAFLNLLFCHGLDVDNWASFAQRTSHLRKKSLEQLIDYGTVVLRHLMDPSEPAPLGWDGMFVFVFVFVGWLVVAKI